MRAMILAAGRGERMRPLTDHTPKPLLQAGGKPLIVWHIERLVAAGIRDIVINHAWLGEKIEAQLGCGKQFKARLQYCAEKTALETAGGIAHALPFFQNKPFLVINGDVWCNWDPSHAFMWAESMARHNALAWLLLVSNPPHHPDGDFLLAGPDPVPPSPPAPGITARATLPIQRVHTLAATEHARVPRCTGPFTFAGIGVYQPTLFADIEPGLPAALAPLLRTAMAQNQVIGTHYSGNWVDVGTPERLNLLNQHLAMQGESRYTSN